MEESLEELKKEEAHQRSTHTELLTEIQQLSCDNQMWYDFDFFMFLFSLILKSECIFFSSRTNITTFEERFNRLRKEMDQMREERTRSVDRIIVYCYYYIIMLLLYYYYL
jgi:hypothetical protein